MLNIPNINPNISQEVYYVIITILDFSNENVPQCPY